MTNGTQTTEFWLALAVVLGATVLLFANRIDQDTWKWAVAFPTAGYALSRGLAKTETVS